MKARRPRCRRALPILLLVLSLSVLPMPAAVADDTASAAERAAEVTELIAQEPASAQAEFQAAQAEGCAGVVWIDTSGVVRGRQPIMGWAVDANATGLTAGVDLIEIYRGDVPVASDTIGVRRLDVDAYWGRVNLRSGFATEIDWSQQPQGEQTYSVWARTDCDWVEARVILDVDPSPPVPAAPAPPPFVAPPPPPAPPSVALSISDDRRTVGAPTVALGPQCVSRDVLGSCLVFSSIGTGSSCISFDVFLGCTAYDSSVGTTTGDVNFDFNITLSGASSQTVLVYYGTADGSATQGLDYAALSGALSFGPGETSKTISVRVYGRDSGGELTFYVRLGSAFNASIADGEGVGTIVRTGSSSATCPVGTSWNGYQCISTGSPGTTSGGTSSTTGGSGYSPIVTASGNVTLTWAPVPGATGYQVWLGTSACTSLTPYGAMQPSTATAQTIVLNGTFCLQVRAQSGILALITSATGATAVTGATGGTISISGTACPAGDPCTFTVTQTGGSGPVTVTYSTQNGTALGAGSCPLTPNALQDYVTSSGTVTVGANSSATISVQTCASGIGESVETFTVILTSTSAGTIAVSQAGGTINP